MDKIYLICNDSMDDMADFKGVIIGNEEQAKEYCEDFNSKCEHSYELVGYEKVEVLNEYEEDDEEGEWIPVGDWILACSKCDGEVEDKDTEECFAFCPHCGKHMKGKRE